MSFAPAPRSVAQASGCSLAPLPPPPPPLPHDSVELYDDESAQRSCHFQLYKELNRVCRQYAHAEAPPAELLQEWGLFQPFAFHLDAAIRALPKATVVLYRGGGYAIDAEGYELGRTGSWGGCLSASSDRLQAVAFVSKEDALKAAKGCYFIILSDEARPMYHVSAFPEEMEHLHPLGQVARARHPVAYRLCLGNCLVLRVLVVWS